MGMAINYAMLVYFLLALSILSNFAQAEREVKGAFADIAVRHPPSASNRQQTRRLCHVWTYMAPA